jgi:uncharacterized protein (DUF1499 family)
MTLQIIGALIVTIVGLGVVKNNKTPEELGVNNGKLAAISSKPNNVSSQTDVKEKFVEPLKFQGDLEASKAKILEIIENYEGAEIIKNETDYIYAVFTTSKMRFKDDVEFYLDKNSDLIHYRSASRVGKKDFGVNRDRYNDISEKYYK